MTEGIPKRALCLCVQAKRDFMRKALSSAPFKISFITGLTETTGAISEFRPDALIHDWQSLNESQARQFHLKFGQTTQAVDLVRVILVPEVNPNMVAFANDALVEKVQSYGAASLNLAAEILMLLDARESNELYRLTREIRLSTFRYDQKAIDLKIRELYEKFPHDPKVKLEFGNLSIHSGQYEEALRLADELLAKDQFNLRAINLQARARMKLGHWDEAIGLLNSAQLLSPQNPERLIMMGDAFYGKGDLEKALHSYGEAMDIDPDLAPKAQRGIGRIKLDQGQLEDALDMFKGSVSEEESAGFFNNAAVQAAKDEKLDNALRLYETALKALKTDKLKPTIYFNIALTLLRLDRRALAKKALKRALHYNPEHEKSLQVLEKLEKDSV